MNDIIFETIEKSDFKQSFHRESDFCKKDLNEIIKGEGFLWKDII